MSIEIDVKVWCGCGCGRLLETTSEEWTEAAEVSIVVDPCKQTRDQLVEALKGVNLLKKEDGWWLSLEGPGGKSCAIHIEPPRGEIVRMAVDEWLEERGKVLKAAGEEVI